MAGDVKVLLDAMEPQQVVNNKVSETEQLTGTMKKQVRTKLRAHSLMLRLQGQASQLSVVRVPAGAALHINQQLHYESASGAVLILGSRPSSHRLGLHILHKHSR